MLRSSSGLLGNKAIDFNPKQCNIGSSSVDKLPLRKVSSQKNIHKTFKCMSGRSVSRKSEKRIQENQQNFEYNMDILRRINQSLTRENLYLKKQLQYYASKIGKNQSTQQDKHKEKLLNRINKNEFNQTQSKNMKKYEDYTIQQTGYGLINSKTSTGRRQAEDNISEYYQLYENKGTIPSLSALKQVVEIYFNNIKQHCQKIQKMLSKSISFQIAGETIQKNKRQHSKSIENMLKLLETLQLPQKSQKITKNLFKVPMEQAIKQSKGSGQKITDFYPELSSPAQIINVFQLLSKFILKSPRILDKIKSSLSFIKLMKKVKE